MRTPRTGSSGQFVAQEIVWRDPLTAFEAVADRDWPILLDSAGPVGPRSRWSFLACDPFTTLVVEDGKVLQNGLIARESDAFEALRRLLAEHRLDSAPDALCDGVRPPFQGGAMGFIAYDAVEWLERVPAPADPRSVSPDLAIGLYGVMCAFDRERERAWIIAHGRTADSAGSDVGLSRRRAEMLAKLVERPLAVGRGSTNHFRQAQDDDRVGQPFGHRSVDSPSRSSVESAIGRVVEYVHAGDIFQANLSQPFGVTISPNEGAAVIYRRAREATPAPFGACMKVAGLEIVSVSPERFISSNGERVETRPIKGTRPRRADPDQDAAEAAALCASPKDRAENVMIVDLMRNDLSRVCRDGSVEVEAICALESHPTVHHLVSTISGRLRPGADAVDILRASFPAGSITGAPKVRAMEIIAELEAERRGVYCGCIGYFGFDGVMDTNVAIRTIVVKGDRATVRAGGGIVADSVPAAEFDEMLDKVRAPLLALGAVADDARSSPAVVADAERVLANRSTSRFTATSATSFIGISADGLSTNGIALNGTSFDESSAREIAPSGISTDDTSTVDGPALGSTSVRGSTTSRVLVIDNYDSFVYTIARYIGELGAERTVVRNDATTLAAIEALDPTHIVISPGPRAPADAGISIDVIRRFGTTIPILGICLGHQAIAEAYGGKVIRGQWPMHGQRTMITHDGDRIFKGIPSPIGVGRYHSLVVDPAALPADLEVTAFDEQGVIMALRHRVHPVVGVQFHPESVLSDFGHAMFAHFLDIPILQTVGLRQATEA